MLGKHTGTMKKTLALLLVGFVIFAMASKDSMAAKRSKKSAAGAISQEEMTSMAQTIDTLTRKVYANSLFSPTDNSNMIEIKIKLDNQMLIAPDASLAPLYYKAANLYKVREYKQEAIDCYQTILENFPDTALAPKARQSLQAMGIAVVDPNAEEGTTTGQAASSEGTETPAATDASTEPADSSASK